jgi:hypothetical protein
MGHMHAGMHWSTKYVALWHTLGKLDQEILQAMLTAFCSKQKDGMMQVKWIIRLPPPQAHVFQNWWEQTEGPAD